MKNKLMFWRRSWEKWVFIKMAHQPVLLKEVIEHLSLEKSSVVLDATINGGGHAMAICGHLSSSGKLIGIEQDKSILGETERKLKKCNPILLNGNFRDMEELLKSVGVESLDAVLFDLGMSSLQLDESDRGFSFQKDEPLSMNFKSELGPSDITAKEILNRWSEEDICEMLKEYGEEKFARRISSKIVEERKRKKFKTTFDLVEAIREGVPVFYTKKRIHFATKTFQALRIEVNDELQALKEGLLKSWNLLNKDGRLVVISFHSLEDRIVKNFLRDKKEEGEGLVLTKKPIEASDEEKASNPRSRSAKLRAIIKL